VIRSLTLTGILTTDDANRSIATTKAKEDAAEEKRFAKEYKKSTVASHHLWLLGNSGGGFIHAVIFPPCKEMSVRNLLLGDPLFFGSYLRRGEPPFVNWTLFPGFGTPRPEWTKIGDYLR
jgi:hypothetical protein